MLQKLASVVFAGTILCGSAFAQNAPDGLAVLDSAGYQRLQGFSNSYGLGAQLTLLTFRSIPSLLDEQPIMQCFIRMNNEGTLTMSKAIQESHENFDYPTLAAFYKSQAPQIEQLAPSTFTLALGGVPGTVQGRRMAAIGVYLGQYDMARKAFPFVTMVSDPVVMQIDRVSPQAATPVGCNFAGFTVVFPPVSFHEVPMDEAAARDFVRQAYGLPRRGGTVWSVQLAMEVEVLPGPPKVIPQGGQRSFVFNGRFNKLMVQYNRKTIATLIP